MSFTTNSFPNFVQANLGVTQVTDIGVGDHVKWDTITEQSSSQSGSSAHVVLDTTSPYNIGVGVPSVGRFSLQPGYRYILEGYLTVNLSAGPGASAQGQWFNASTGVAIGAIAVGFNQNAATTSDSFVVQAEITPTGIGPSLFEVRFVAAAGFTGLTSGFNQVHVRQIG